jgi:hypothetical protein
MALCATTSFCTHNATINGQTSGKRTRKGESREHIKRSAGGTREQGKPDDHFSRGMPVRWYTVYRRRSLQTPQEFLDTHLNIPQDRSQKTRSNGFACMYGNCRHPAVGVLEEDVTAASADRHKTEPLQDPNNLPAPGTGKACHTEICWIPTSSSAGPPRTSSE